MTESVDAPKSDLTADPAKAPSITGAALLRETAPFLLLLFVLGVWQHISFSYSVGELAFFKNGYDEDTYFLNPFGLAGWRPDRVLSGTVATVLIALSNGSYNIPFMVFDAIFPPLIFAAAYFAGSTLFRDRPARALFALALMFSSDLFSLGSVASFPGPFPTLAQFARIVGEAHVPPIETSYLSIYRSPEPQAAFFIGYVFIGLLLQISLGRGVFGSKARTVGLIAVQLLMLCCYAIVSYPLLLIEGAIAVLLLIEGRRREAFLLAGLCALSIAAMVISARMTLGPSTTAIFASRVPVIAVSTVLALALAITISIFFLRDRKIRPQLAVAMAFALMPLALTNQQILTGAMISVKDWERSINLAFVVVSAGILLSTLNWRLRGSQWAIGATIILVAAFVSVASVRTYRMWLPDNQKSLAIARAIQAAQSDLGKDVRWVLYQPEYAPWVEARLRPQPGHKFNPLIDYTETFKSAPSPTSGFSPSHLSASLFEFWRQTAVSPEAARNILVAEARARSGYYSAFLFSVCEYWSPCTDGRHVQTDKIMAATPSVVDAYAAYLGTPQPPTKLAFVGLDLKSPANSILIGTGQVGNFLASAVVRNPDR